MYRLNIKKQELGDLIVLLLFDKLFNKEFIEESELFNTLIEVLENKGMKSKLFQYYFDVDPSLRSKYKHFSRKIEEQNASVWIKEDTQQNESYEEQLITEVVKKVTGKDNPNEEKLQMLINELLYQEEQ